MLKNIIFASVVFVCSVVTEPAFAANDIVFEKNHKTIDLNMNGTLAQVSEIAIRLVSEQGAKIVGQIPLPYSESLQSIEVLEAYTLRPDGTRLDVAKDKIITQAAPVAVMSGAWSIAWLYHPLFSGASPANTTSGRRARTAAGSAVINCVTPGPQVTVATPASQVLRAYAIAAATAQCSCRT